MPIEALVNPFPKELTTPPVTKMCFVMGVNLTFERMPNEGTAGDFAILPIAPA
jgi:hypothetical protein